MSKKQLVSIVMPSFNQARYIQQSIESVLGQNLRTIELVVQDGGSSDGTQEILGRLAARDDRIKWRSEPDNGPAQAINRALERSRGTIIGWLNSDDLYTEHAIERSIHALSEPSSLLVYGHGDYIGEHGAHLSRYPTREPEVGLKGFGSGCFICQPTAFFKRTAYTLLGPLDEGLKTSFDMDYWMRAFKRFPERIGFVDALQAQSRLHPDCITSNQRRTVATEGILLTARYLGSAEGHWVTSHLEEIAANVKTDLDANQALSAIDTFFKEIDPYFPPEVLDQMRRQVSLMIGPSDPPDSA